MWKFRASLVTAAVLLVASWGAQAQTRLPVSEGVYAESGASCASGWLWVYTGRRAGYLSFYGPNQSMGPRVADVETIRSVGPGHDGFTAINDAGEEVLAAEDGEIIVRAYSRAQGEIERTRFRQCPISALHPRMRAAVAELGLR